ncbi:S1 family peptidase [Streptomyces sp. NRRL B-1347]|uniref:S1 family peptidase n=1 Tax=Streptomyces sp. NRRL B-1347 TaxID=1476877 RepID=UPI0004C6D7EB|nr:serine protease [Streptomyces sp. NRRL B-1347]
MTPRPDEDPLLDLLARCTVSIRERGGRSAGEGTGFLVGPGLVLTCAHVVASDDHPQVFLEGRALTATVRARYPQERGPSRHPPPDLALLDVDVADHPWVELDQRQARAGRDRDELLALGWTRALDDGTPGARPALHSMGYVCEGTVDVDGHQLLELDGRPIIDRMSGGPVLNLRTGRVAAVMRMAHHDHFLSTGGWAVPLTGLDADHPSGLHPATLAVRLPTHPAWRAARRRSLVPRLAELLRPAHRPDEALRVRGEATADSYSRAQLLRPSLCLVPFGGRDADHDRLAAWCAQPEPFSLALVTGPGGVGKTRLAVELARTMDGRGWITGMVPRPAQLAAPTAWIGPLADALETLDEPALLVVDYGEDHPALVALVTALNAAARHTRRAVRLLVLARQERHLLREMSEQLDSALRPLTDLDADGRHIRLGALPPLVDPQQEYERAVHVFADVLGIPAQPGRPAPPTDGTPLLQVHAAALVRVLGTDEPPADGTRGSTFRNLLAHEAAYWAFTERTLPDAAGTPLPAGLRRTAVALAAVTGARDREQGTALLRAALDLGPRRAERTARWLHQLYETGSRDGDDHWPAIQPDPVAELLVADLCRDDPEPLAAALAVLPKKRLGRALGVLGRSAEHAPEARDLLVELICRDLRRRLPLAVHEAARSGAVMGRAVRDALERADARGQLDVRFFRRLARALLHYDEPSNLIDAALWMHAGSIRLWRDDQLTLTPEQVSDHLLHLVRLACLTGEDEVADAAQEQSLALHLAWYADEPEAAAPHLVGCQLSQVRLHMLRNRSADALTAARAALDVWHRHPGTAVHPSAVERLHEFAAVLPHLGLADQAEEFTEQAATDLAALAATDQVARVNLAVLRATQVERWALQGRPGAALDVLEESLRVLRDTDVLNDQEKLLPLALVLVSRAGARLLAGPPPLARECALEALGTARRLPRTLAVRPLILSSALNQAALCEQMAEGSRELALRLSESAVAVASPTPENGAARPLATAALVQALHSRADILKDYQDLDGALECALAAVEAAESLDGGSASGLGLKLVGHYELARIQLARGALREAGTAALAARRLIDEGGAAVALFAPETDLLLAQAYDGIGEPARALPYAARAIQELRDLTAGETLHGARRELSRMLSVAATIAFRCSDHASTLRYTEEGLPVLRAERAAVPEDLEARAWLGRLLAQRAFALCGTDDEAALACAADADTELAGLDRTQAFAAYWTSVHLVVPYSVRVARDERTADEALAACRAHWEQTTALTGEAELGYLLSNLGLQYAHAGRPLEGLRLGQAAVASYDRHPVPDLPTRGVTKTLVELASCALLQQRPEAAEEALARALPTARAAYATDHQWWYHLSLALAHSAQLHEHHGDVTGAEGLYREYDDVVAHLADAEWSAQHALAVQGLRRHTLVLERLGRRAAALAILDRLIAWDRRSLAAAPDRRPAHFVDLHRKVFLLLGDGRWQEAMAAADDLADAARYAEEWDGLLPDTVAYLRFLTDRARGSARLYVPGLATEAKTAFAQALKALKGVSAQTAATFLPEATATRMSLSSCLGFAGDWEAALRHSAKALREWNDRTPGSHAAALSQGIELRVQRGWARWHLSDLNGAVRDIERATAELRALDPPDRPRLARARAVRALIHLERRETPAAREAAEEAVHLWETARAEDPTLESMPYIGCLLIRAATTPEHAATDRARAAELTAAHHLEEHPEAAEVRWALRGR